VGFLLAPVAGGSGGAPFRHKPVSGKGFAEYTETTLACRTDCNLGMKDPLVAAFDRLASRFPTDPIVVSPRGKTVTLEGLHALSCAAEARVPTRLPSGSLVGLVAPNGPIFLAVLLALRRRGFAVLLLDPSAPAPEARGTAQALGASALLTCSGAWLFHEAGPSSEYLLAPGTRQLPSVIAAVKVTSGSAGGPRGVAVSCEALLADDAALALSMGLRAEDRILAAIPMSHSYGFSSVVLPALVRGSVLVVPDDTGPLTSLHAAAVAGATVFPTAPAFLDALLRMSQPPAWPESIRLVICAGAPLLPVTAARFREAYSRRVHAFYGASECGGICYDREGGAAERGTVGTPVEGARVTLDPIAGSNTDEGAVSVVSPAVGETYVPEADARLAAGHFQTTDVGVWRGGELKLLRRIDALINVKGRKVDPSEIEAVVAGLAGVEEVVALGVPGQQTGSQLVRVAIACRPGRLSYEDVLAWCRPRLAEHKLPRSIVLLPEIPRTSRGKIDRAALIAFEREKAHE
jgi:acyl-CoA synthetase (AMP-forming)/AMP-acid ligase II